ncbi:hypothetical protein [Entomobacter blattae]|uniref:hypothetical protein n=1 Tax=Entomobacter blattae TaxID=2762277 RepID=UPI00193BF17C|nr:hypothetical protein [Entomobacter blattae]
MPPCQAWHQLARYFTRPDILQDVCSGLTLDASLIKRPIPPPHAIDCMDEAFSWVQLISAPPKSSHGGAVRRRLVLLRSFVNVRSGRHIFSWSRLGRILGANLFQT